MDKGLELFVHCVISHNVVLFQGLGVYVLLNYTKNLREACRFALMAVIATLTSGIIIWASESLLPSGIDFRFPIIMAIAVLSGLFWHKFARPFVQASGSHRTLPAFVNSALVGVFLLGYQYEFTGTSLIGYGFYSALGYGLILIIMAGIRERLELAAVPKPMKGVPIVLITAGLFALALMGFRF